MPFGAPIPRRPPPPARCSPPSPSATSPSSQSARACARPRAPRGHPRRPERDGLRPVPGHPQPPGAGGRGGEWHGRGGWIPVNPTNLKTRFPGVYAIGDVTSVGTPKAGLFAEGAARVVAAALVAELQGATNPRRTRAPVPALSSLERTESDGWTWTSCRDLRRPATSSIRPPPSSARRSISEPVVGAAGSAYRPTGPRRRGSDRIAGAPVVYIGGRPHRLSGQEASLAGLRCLRPITERPALSIDRAGHASPGSMNARPSVEEEARMVGAAPVPGSWSSSRR